MPYFECTMCALVCYSAASATADDGCPRCGGPLDDVGPAPPARFTREALRQRVAQGAARNGSAGHEASTT